MPTVTETTASQTDGVITEDELTQTEEITTLQPQTEAPKLEKYNYNRVIVIGVDGAGAFFKNANTPEIDKIFAGGAVTYTMKASNPSISAECWGSILTGVSPSKHGLTNSIVVENEYKNTEYPTVFSYIRTAYPTCGLAGFVNWEPINTGIIENGLDVEKKSVASDERLTSGIVSYIKKTDFKFMFVQFDEVDGAGHTYGYGTEKHLQQIEKTDGYIKEIYDALSENGGIDNTLFIVTADHGGNGTTHGGSSEAEMKVFCGVAGKTVCKTELGDISNRDIPQIVTTALGIEGNPKWESYLPIGLFSDAEGMKRPSETLDPNVSAHKTTPERGSEAYITNFIKAEKIKDIYFFDGNIAASEGNNVFSEKGKLYYSDGFIGQSLRISADGSAFCEDLKFGTDSFSISLFIKCGTQTDDPPIFSNKDWTLGLYSGFVFCVRPGDMKFNVGYNGEIRSDYELSYPDGMNADIWTHMLISVDREANTISFYRNFKLLRVSSLDEGFKGLSFDSEYPFTIGQDGTGKYPCELDAQLDDLIIINGTMSEEEVDRLSEYYLNK